jgi:hypothetical protein
LIQFPVALGSGAVQLWGVRQHHPQTSMDFLSYLISRENFRNVTGCDDVGAYWRFEFFWHVLLGFCLAGVAALVGIGYVGYRLWKEITLEINFQQKYGANWQAEFERYYGSLAHTHLRLYVALFCLLALLAILLWFGWRFIKSPRKRRHSHVA